MLYNRSKSNITLLLMIAIGLTAASIDIYIASLPFMVDYFNSTQEMLQFTISASIIGSSICTLFIGPLSDAIGRRNLIVYGQAFYGIFNILASFSTNVDYLIFCRFMMGTVSCATFVLGFAVISDIYNREEASVNYANITTSILIALIIAPLIGGYFAEIQRWDYSFLFLGFAALLSALSLWLYLPETLHHRKRFSFKTSARTYAKMLSNPRFIVLTITPSILIGGVLSFFANGSFYYIEELGLSEWEYSKHQILIMGSNCIFSFFAGRMIRKFGLNFTCSLGMLLVFIGGITFTLTAFMFPVTPLLMTLPLAVFASGTGFSFSSLASMAMQENPDSPGISSALIALVRGTTISIIIGLSGFLYVDQSMEIGLTIFAITASAMGLYSVIWQHQRQTYNKTV